MRAERLLAGVLATAAALSPTATRRQLAGGLAGGGLALVAPPALAADVLEIPPATTKMGGLLEKYADATRGAENSYEPLHAVNRGFRLLKPTTWNQFDGEPGAYDVRWVDVVAPAESVTLSTSSYNAGQSIEDLAAVDKLGAKLAAARGTLTGARARRSDSILFYDYSFSGEGRRELLTMCVHKGRLWQLTAKAPEASWGKREALYLNVVGSFVPKL
ncbi:unnamed protein product [Pelagomonas calceolata]|uniref:PsbP C-terminal domain-containing protein n=1 Tax=Pelagomonas calceolata TaxID=35677 RepID=A0A8J2X2K3_9STRA|nr:unnamed protein product [Pelagomonas calceolata]